MGRKKAAKAKRTIVSLRTYEEVGDAIEDYARREHRAFAQMAELLLREAIIARRAKDKESADDIEALP